MLNLQQTNQHINANYSLTAIAEKLERLRKTGLFPDKILNKMAEFQKEIFDPTQKKFDRIMDERLFVKDKKKGVRREVNTALPMMHKIASLPLVITHDLKTHDLSKYDPSEVENYMVSQYQKLAQDYATCFANTLPFQPQSGAQNPYQQCIDYYKELLPETLLQLPSGNKRLSDTIYKSIRLAFFQEIQKAIDDGNIEPPKSQEERDAMNQIKELSNARIGPGSGKRHKGQG